MLDGHFVQHFSMSEATPGSVSCEQLKQQHPKRVHICALAELAFQQKLWRHVCHCTVSLRLHMSFITHSTQPKVSHLQQQLFYSQGSLHFFFFNIVSEVQFHDMGLREVVSHASVRMVRGVCMHRLICQNTASAIEAAKCKMQGGHKCIVAQAHCNCLRHMPTVHTHFATPDAYGCQGVPLPCEEE